STFVALRTLVAMKPGRGGKRIVVLGDMLELGKTSRAEHKKIGEEIGKIGGISAALFFGPEMRAAHKALVAQDSVESAHFASKERLAGALLARVGPADIVLVKGSRGMKMEEVVRELLAAGEPN